MAKPICERCWISLILRISVSALFISAVIPKYTGGFENVVTAFQGMFAKTWLPMPLVTLHARLTPFVETLIPIWLLIGFRLRFGWVFTSLFLVSLSFGMLVAGQGAIAANNFFYVALSLGGLYFSQFDRWSVDSPATKGS